VLRRLFLLLLGGACLASPVLATGASPAVAMGAASDATNPVNDQGSNSNYRSNITAVTPKVPGLSIQVLEFADRMVLRRCLRRSRTRAGAR